jgi:hypothetical protein
MRMNGRQYPVNRMPLKGAFLQACLQLPDMSVNDDYKTSGDNRWEYLS